MRLIGVIGLLLILVACGGDDTPIVVIGDELDTPVVIDRPLDGMIVYAETLLVRGRAQAETRFTLQLVDTEEEIITRTTLQPDGESGVMDWQIELPHSYTGDPTEATLRAVPADLDSATGEQPEPYDRVTLVLSNIENRPEGVFGSLISPNNGVEVGGDLIPVSGRASGVEIITVEFIGEDGTEIDIQTIDLDNPNIIDDVSWQVDLNRGDYTGQATIRAYATPEAGEEVVFGNIRVTVITVAG